MGNGYERVVERRGKSVLTSFFVLSSRDANRFSFFLVKKLTFW
ncbi:hypothetical protein DFO53_3244 [Enterobacter sp. AG5470]|nr:hypothetical protein DFO53_3244 [Enterobacter sp. AG5470]